MKKPRVLIVEDEADIRRFVRMSLECEDMTVFEAADAAQGRIECVSRRPDLLIVDLGLPDEDGKVLIRELRSWSRAPVLVLSAREHETEKVEALNLGADDYLTKPFGVPELIARVRAQLRRASFVGGASTSPLTK
jgi:two-component system KDP operon response regulator KdpE